MMTAPLWLALALAAPADAPVTVEVVAIGHTDAPATRFALAVDINATGDTEAKAKANVDAIKAKLTQQFAAAGVTVMPEEKPTTTSSDTIATDVAAAADDAEPAKGSASAEGKMMIQAGTRAAITQAQAIITRTPGASANGLPISSITDRAAASRVAKTNAIGRAKLDAQNYANALGYSNASVVSVSERGDMGTLFNYAMETFGVAMTGVRSSGMFSEPHGDTVPIDVAVTVTFRLDGKK